MVRRLVVVCHCTLALAAGAAFAQHGPVVTGPPLLTNPPPEARQLDFLVGQWELVALPKVSTLVAVFHGQPKLVGTWKAWRALDGFGIDEELRLTDETGNPLLLSRSLRIFDRARRRWSGSTLDVYRARFSDSTGESKGGQVTFTTSGTDAEGKRYVMRGRFYDVKPNAFRWQQDRSYDGGKTWDETLKIEARRVAAAAPR
ncbi:MAG TPA: hypothetical protein VGS57_14325 [Thermoanaerobaculia bacterium]|jgi:hypothetical protein|nr:hypothetical protein [Thermoanaerobaculia bacterium]